MPCLEQTWACRGSIHLFGFDGAFLEPWRRAEVVENAGGHPTDGEQHVVLRCESQPIGVNDHKTEREGSPEMPLIYKMREGYDKSVTEFDH
eukprot:4364585-Amphidinium_carterae.1